MDVGETHFTHPMLVFFRSSEPWHSWVTAVATLLEAANFRLSAIQASGPGNAAAWMFYRAGMGAVARLRSFFGYRIADREVEPVDRTAFERVLFHFEEIGVPIVDDHDGAWERFSQRRADYEPVVDALARLVDAPAVLWPAESTSTRLRRPRASPTRGDELASARRLDGRRERRDVIGAVMAQPVDEEGRRARDGREVGRVDVLRDPGCSGPRPHVLARSARCRAPAASA